MKRSQEEIDEYNASTWERILNKSEYRPCPEGKGLTTPCLIWGAYTAKTGYGSIGYSGESLGAHVVSLIIYLHVDKIPKMNDMGEKLEVAHKCDIRNCVEPTHLYLATPLQNGADRVRNGLLRGERNYNAQISEDVARFIKLGTDTESRNDRVEKYGTTLGIVKNIDLGLTWTHLPYSNGSVSYDNKLKDKERRKKRKKELKEEGWTEQNFNDAINILNNPNYVRDHDIYTYNDTKCKMWIRGTVSGYGQMYVGGKSIRAHIMACMIGNGFKQPDGLQAAHECGHPLCVNPLHLKFKTAAENAEDREKHGTRWRKVTHAQAQEIRMLHTSGKSNILLAKIYGVSPKTIRNITKKK